MATATAPMSFEHRMEALGRANRIRSARAVLKAEIKRGEQTLESVLSDIPDCMETMRVFDLLICCPKIGKVKAGVICRKLDIRPSLYLPQLSTLRRQQLLLAIAGLLHGSTSKR